MRMRRESFSNPRGRGGDTCGGFGQEGGAVREGRKESGGWGWGRVGEGKKKGGGIRLGKEKKGRFENWGERF